MKRQFNRQQDAVAIIALAFLAVVLYTLWGASILRAEKQANSGAAGAGQALVVNR